jgi:hypothetical protein
MLVALSTLNPQPESSTQLMLWLPWRALYGRGNQLKFGNDTNGDTRIIMPETQCVYQPGRMNMSREGQTCAFFGGANSIFWEINY